MCTFTDPYIVVTKAGTYKIAYNVSFTTSANAQEIEFGIMLDQTTVQAMGSSHTKSITGRRFIGYICNSNHHINSKSESVYCSTKH